MCFIEETRQIKKLQFCPSKSERLALLTENSTEVNVYRLEEQNNNIRADSIQCN
jgi:hypothetical protein